jgi:hypothetical protein
VIPLYKAEAPSSATIVLVVPIKPEYFGLKIGYLPIVFGSILMPSTNLELAKFIGYLTYVFCIYNLTFTVSSGMVISSATLAEKLASMALLSM